MEIMEELRAGHFADIRNTLDRVGEQTGLPTAVAMLDRLEKLSDIRDQGLTFRLEANPPTPPPIRTRAISRPANGTATVTFPAR